MKALEDENVSTELKDTVRGWFASLDEDRQFDIIKKMFAKLKPNENPDEYEYKQYDRVRRLLGLADINETRKPVLKRRLDWRGYAMRVAAVMIPVLVVVGAAWLWMGSDTGRPVIANVEVSVPEGGQKRIVLPDGSQVWVNSASTVSYNDDFSKERYIALEGEAFFSVMRDSLSPFRVKAGEMVVEVLGTEFSVKSRLDEPTAEVVLESGSVKVETPKGKPIQLSPNERLTFEVATSKTVVDRIAAETVSNWRVTDLLFVDSSLEEALRKIAAYHGHDLMISGTLPDGDLINFDHGGERSLEEILDLIQSLTGNFDYQISEHEIKITPINP